MGDCWCLLTTILALSLEASWHLTLKMYKLSFSGLHLIVLLVNNVAIYLIPQVINLKTITKGD